MNFWNRQKAVVFKALIPVGFSFELLSCKQWRCMMANIFPKTLVVAPSGGDYTDIATAVNALSSTGGVVIVEEAEYTITGSNPISIPSNVALIGRGNARLKVTANVTAIKNSDQTNGNKRIMLSGFKITVDLTSGTLNVPLIHFKRVDNSVVEKLYLIGAPDEGSDSEVGVTASAICFEGTTGPTYCIGNCQ